MSFQDMSQPDGSTYLLADLGADSAANSHLDLNEPIEAYSKGTVVIENDTWEMMYYKTRFPGSTQEHGARGLQTCMRYTEKNADGKTFVIKSFRGNVKRGEVTGTQET